MGGELIHAGAGSVLAMGSIHERPAPARTAPRAIQHLWMPG
jgi:hypothetical protein